MNLYEFALEYADKAINKPNMYIVAGHNGPYNDKETPLRNIGHWIIIFSNCYYYTNDIKYKNKVQSLAEYFFCYSARPYLQSFHHRINKSKDGCNGLIGQAWSFEALSAAAKLTGESKYSELADSVYFKHHFNYKYGLWNRLEIDGRIFSIDMTFNHQLWFATCALMINSERYNKIVMQVSRFLDCLRQNLTILENGLIYHPIEREVIDKHKTEITKHSKLKKSIVNILKKTKFVKTTNNEIVNNGIVRNKMINKSIGYHSFNMYAFSMLKELLPNHDFWTSNEFSSAINYMLTDEYKAGLINNKFGFPYNPPGFEVPYSLYIFKNLNIEKIVEESNYWLNKQFYLTFNPETYNFDRNLFDVATANARFYELLRMPKELLQQLHINGL